MKSRPSQTSELSDGQDTTGAGLMLPAHETPPCADAEMLDVSATAQQPWPEHEISELLGKAIVVGYF